MLYAAASLLFNAWTFRGVLLAELNYHFVLELFTGFNI